MDLATLFYYDPHWRVIICKECRSTPQTSVSIHIRRYHNTNRRHTSCTIAAVDRSYDHLPLLKDPDEISKAVRPLPCDVPIPFLPIFYNGICCLLCKDPKTRYVCRGRTSIMEHLKQVHDLASGSPGRLRRGETGGVEGLANAGLVQTPVACQTLFRGNYRCRYFVINGSGRDQPADSGENRHARAVASSPPLPGLALRDIIENELTRKESQGSGPVALVATDPRLLSHWQQATEWSRFLAPHAHELQDVAKLASLPRKVEVSAGLDGLLNVLITSLDRVVARARASLSEGRLNVFDQHRLNSFIAGRSSRKPLLHTIQEKTYKRYTSVFQRLICYTIRLTWSQAAPKLQHCLTEAQRLAMADVVHCASAFIEAAGDKLDDEYIEDSKQALDDKCLIFLVSLLDHKLYGDIYESVVVGFLAVLGIRGRFSPGPNGAAESLDGAADFTPKLSAFIKIGQLLVAERALLAVKRDEADVPAEALEDMHSRFMTIDSRSPISWALKLRAYGKAVKDNTTSLGHIIWSDDDESLSYGKLRFSMTGLRDLVATEVRAAQSQLEELLLVPPDAERADIVPKLSLRSVADDPSESRLGWNFIQHPDNDVLRGYERWILDRVINEEYLRNDFFQSEITAQWRTAVVARYVASVEAFLERLLLLVHITGGQPARGTELLCIQHSNSKDGSGGRRNVFIENGLVSFVTYYHKGYPITGTTKIIHRYLPKEVGELLLYYLWLIVPFLDQLSKLAKLPSFTKDITPYIWGEFRVEGALAAHHLKTLGQQNSISKRAQIRRTKKVLLRTAQKPDSADLRETQPESAIHEGSWPTTRLSAVLKSTFRRLLNTEANVQTWRHAAIAISRRHLQQAKFKRDFIEAISWAWNDEMAAHSTKLAGLVYARGLDEAPGHIAGAKAEYRRICREWHSWLGFGGYRSTL